MSITSKVEYKGDFKCETTHIKSGSTVMTDAPVDNKGKGEYLSPTDLFVSTLAQCSLTTIAILGTDRGINIDGATCNVTKNMTQSPPRRIAEIVCAFYFPGKHDERARSFIEKAVKTCPVAQSIHPEIKLTHSYTYAED